MMRHAAIVARVVSLCAGRVPGVRAAQRQLSDEGSATDRPREDSDRQRRLHPRTKNDFATLRADLKSWREAVSETRKGSPIRCGCCRERMLYMVLTVGGKLAESQQPDRSRENCCHASSAGQGNQHQSRHLVKELSVNLCNFMD